MRCACCDVLLTDFEATRRDKLSGRYPDLCGRCFSADVSTKVVERWDLFSSEDIRDTEDSGSGDGLDLFVPYVDDEPVDDFNPNKDE